MAEINAQKSGLSRRTITILACGVVAAIILTLLAYERIDLMYLLATLGLIGLLIRVATANLERTDNLEK